MSLEALRFRYPWRPYQKRVLRAIEDHLEDNRLHIVAAPGAGKTSLGLEVFRLLGKSALILSPTRIIRDQWIDRLKDFCDVENPEQLEWVSNSIHEPSYFTSITYQALHAQLPEHVEPARQAQQSPSSETAEAEEDDEEFELDAGLNEEELSRFVQSIERHGFELLILDEAHHLRAEWWKALDKVCSHLPDITLLSLTATPPYDAHGAEWSRYEQLCGPIDEEISVPELVQAKTLCAHQDFVWCCDATANEKKQVSEYDQRVSTLCHTLFQSEEFQSLVLSHRWLSDRDIEAEVIKNPEVAISIVSYLAAKQLASGAELLEILDMDAQDIPELGRKWWQVLVETLLFSNSAGYSEAQIKFIASLKKQLKASELLNKRELSLVRSRRTDRYLSLSSAKIAACAELHQMEYAQRGDSLRQVFLTDYIRDEAYTSGLNTGQLNLGAWPVFNYIKMASPVADEVALLTGRLSVLHESKIDVLLNYVDHDRIQIEPVKGEDSYKKVSGTTSLLSTAFTQLLINGHIKTLIGTRSLLGEGWDAPVVNSLVLASSVGSFMLTNQMRGRAIRVDPNVPDKTSSIWHLVAINPETYSGWGDLYGLWRRFDTFVGLSEKELIIESGFERMNLKNLKPKFDIKQSGRLLADDNNSEMQDRLRRLTSIKQRWEQALILDHAARVVPGVKTARVPRLRGLVLKHSFAYLLTQVAMAVLATVIGYWYTTAPTSDRPLLFFAVAIAIALLYKLPKTWSLIKIVFRHLPVDGSIRRIGIALSEALCTTGFIETSARRIKVQVHKSGDGQFFVSLTGSTFYESSLFADCLSEILAPIDNPRYLILREGTFLGTQRDDYHAVPIKLATKKEFARVFYKSWCKNVSLSELIYTRTPEGRKRLLKAKMRSFSSNFHNEVKRQDQWQ